MGVSITYPGTLPDINSPATFNERALALYTWLVGQSSGQLLGELADMDASDFFSVQSSPTDTTAGRLMPVGAFGLGNIGNGNTLADLDAFDNPAGLHRTTSSTAGTFPTFNGGSAVGAFGFLFEERYNANLVKQTYTVISLVGNGANRVFTRVGSVAGGWNPWKEQYSTENILGTVSQSGGDPTGAIIESGTTASGNYMILTDGTQICWHDDIQAVFNSASIMLATWDYPVDFKTGTAPSVSLHGDSTGANYVGLSTLDLGWIGIGQSASTMSARIYRTNGATRSFTATDEINAMRAIAVGEADI